jgi:tetratricopeptide (TPR) repeat protein
VFNSSQFARILRLNWRTTLEKKRKAQMAMHSGNKFAPIKRSTDALLVRVQQFIGRSEYANAEKLAREALDNWRVAGAPREDEGILITTLGKCLEAQRKYEEAYELYMQALNYLTGPAYDEVYTNFLYLNERMGTFGDKSRGGPKPPNAPAKQDDSEPRYPKGYFDDFGQ